MYFLKIQINPILLLKKFNLNYKLITLDAINGKHLMVLTVRGKILLFRKFEQCRNIHGKRVDIKRRQME